MQLRKETIALLEDIERRIDPAVEEDLSAQWKDFLYGRFEGDLFTAKRKAVSAPGVSLPAVHINDAIDDLELMLQFGLQDISSHLSTDTLSPCIRANYGTGIMSSLFGAELFIMPRCTNNLPTTRAFNDTEVIRGLVEKGMPDLLGGLGQRVFDFGELCAEVFAHYPNIQKYAEVYHPDTQGPLDVCELMWGSEMFLAMYDEPELVHGMLRLVTDTYTAFLEKWFGYFPMHPEMSTHWASLRHRGGIVLRDDSAMNLSSELYKEFAAPYDAELLKHFKGGVVHFCGRGDHYMETLCGIPDLTGVNMSQPDYNDMEVIYRNTVDKGIPLLAFHRPRAEADLGREGGFHHRMSVV